LGIQKDFMNAWELWLAAGLYVSVAIRYGQHGDPGMCVAFIAYAAANVGMFFSSVSKV
jgi:hypothetical protein